MSRADDHFEMDEWPGSPSPELFKVMIVELNTGSSNYLPVQQNATRRAQSTDTDGASSVSFSTQSLQETLKQSAAVRPDKVAQASALVSDGAYPSDAALNQLAGFLANRI